MTASMPAARYIQTNGIRMAVYEAGAANAALPPVVLCHGFPETAFSWRAQLRDLPARGLRVLAPDQRGYGHTDRPEAVTDYDMAHLTGDLIGLLDAYDIEKAVFCGHDWGGSVVWDICRRHPDRVAGVIGVNTPYRVRGPVDLVTAYEARFGPDYYVVHFQKPDLADRQFAADVEKTMKFFMRAAPPGKAPKPDARPRETKGRFALQDLLEKFDRTDDRGQFLNPEELDAYVELFERSGFTGGVNWYRNLRRNWETSAHLPDTIDQPSLMIMGENDAVLPPSLSDGMEDYIPRLTKHLVRDCGHWTQQEKPDEVTRVIADWMKTTFG